MGEDEGLKKRGIIDFLPLKREGLYALLTYGNMPV